MGARLVASALAVATRRLETHAARLALLAMAHHAKDTDTHPLYFGGSDALEEALGYPPRTERGRKAVQRAMAELVRYGYVEPVEGTRRSWNRRWLLKLNVFPLAPPSADRAAE